MMLPDWLIYSLSEFCLQTRHNINTLQISSFESRYFSSVFKITLSNFKNEFTEQSYSFFVKIPRADMRRGLDHIPIPVKGDIELARKEYSAARTLASEWPTGRSEFLRPVFFFEKYGILIYPWYDSQLLINNWQSKNYRGSTPSSIIRTANLLGRELACFHIKSLNVRKFEFYDINKKFKIIENDLVNLGVNSNKNYFTKLFTNKFHNETPLAYAKAIKGFELRNIMKLQDDKIILFDPGYITEEPIYADIARFIVSCKMLWWGKPSFFFYHNTLTVAIHAFINGYQSELKLDKQLVSPFIMREILKQWRTSLKVVHLKKLPNFSKKIVSSIYVNFPFSRLLEIEYQNFNHSLNQK